VAVKIEEMDSHVTYARQLEQPTGPVVLVNLFSIDPSEEEAFLAAWRESAAFMKRQAGFIATQMHRGIGGSGAYLNVAIWESAAALAAATSSPEFRALSGRFPGDVVARPHVFEKVAVPGTCVA
jgi:heme-degrading monooxygenase HmoA